MRIALVNQPLDVVLPPRQGSLSIWNWLAAARLAERHDVRIYGSYSRLEPSTAGVHPAASVDVHLVRCAPHRLSMAVMRLRDLIRPSGVPPFAREYYHREYPAAVAADLRAFRPDIVHVMNFSQFLPVFRQAVPDARIGLHVQCDWLNLLPAPVVRPRLDAANVIIGCSDSVLAQARTAMPDLAGRMHTVPNAVDVDVFHPDPESRSSTTTRILFVGRLSPEKGVHDLLEAYAAAKAQNESLELDVIGPDGRLPADHLVELSSQTRMREFVRYYEGGDDYGRSLRKRASRVGGVRFLGHVAHDEIVSHYNRADILALPSVHEAFGIPLAEAMACGVATIASDDGGLADITRVNQAGMLVAPGKPEQLTEAILELARDPDRRQRMGKAGRRVAVEQFSWESTTARLLTLYGEVELPRRPVNLFRAT